MNRVLPICLLTLVLWPSSSYAQKHARDKYSDPKYHYLPYPYGNNQKLSGYKYSGPYFYIPPYANKANGSRTHRVSIDGLAAQGMGLIKRGNVDEGMQKCREALTRAPQRPDACLAMAYGYEMKGDLSNALKYYHACFFGKDGQWGSWYSTTTPVLIDYASALEKAGQHQEAVAAANRAIFFVNFVSGHPHIPVLLPSMDESDSAHSYTPQRFQALCLLCRALDGNGSISPTATGKRQIEQALKLQPNLAAAHFYLGVALQNDRLHYAVTSRKAKAEYLKAAALVTDERGRKFLKQRLEELQYVR